MPSLITANSLVHIGKKRGVVSYHGKNEISTVKPLKHSESSGKSRPIEQNNVANPDNMNVGVGNGGTESQTLEVHWALVQPGLVDEPSQKSVDDDVQQVV